jgi:hypothetical protein
MTGVVLPQASPLEVDVPGQEQCSGDPERRVQKVQSSSPWEPILVKSLVVPCRRKK